MYNRVELKRDARKTFKTIRKLIGNRQCRKDLKMVTIFVCYLTLLFALVFSSCDIVDRGHFQARLHANQATFSVYFMSYSTAQT